MRAFCNGIGVVGMVQTFVGTMMYGANHAPPHLAIAGAVILFIAVFLHMTCPDQT